MMTKQQEREALSRIENILADAGADSYIGMAFAGCVGLAEDNIGNDFGCSMKDRAEFAERKAKEAQEEAERAKAEADALRDRMAAKESQIDQLKAALSAEKAKHLPADLYRDLWLMIEGRRCTAENEIAQEAEHLARFADCPTDIAVGSAIKRLAVAKARRDEYAALLERLEKVEETE